MSIRIFNLILTGPDKNPATIEFDGQSHLIFGPTDTGKTYIIECLQYGLGSDVRPRDIGYSEGYTQLALQIAGGMESKKFTIFRDFTTGSEAVYEGFHSHPSQVGANPTKENIAQLIISLCNGADKQILTKSGKVGPLSAGDLRHISLFDEITTLNKTSLEGSDKLFKMRNKAAISTIITGVDDSHTVLVPSTEKRNMAKGYAEALDAEIEELRSTLPADGCKEDVADSLAKVTRELAGLSQYLSTNAKELSSLKLSRQAIEKEIEEFSQRATALNEAQERFVMLEAKYLSDLQRLKAISTAASVFNAFEMRPCPLCFTEIQYQARQTDQQPFSHTAIMEASSAEIHKIESLRVGLRRALSDVQDELREVGDKLVQCKQKEKENLKAQTELLHPASRALNVGIAELTEKKAELSLMLRDFERIEVLEARRKNMLAKAKRKKQVVERDLSVSAVALCSRIAELLKKWGVPGIQQVYYNESVADININQRMRISFGKGKRGIFLTAYAVALMEHAIENGHPHLGFVAIDSPVVTYKDPKHGTADPEEALDISVKDHFYAWLADRTSLGQVIILENEEPDKNVRLRLRHTEFVGHGSAEGRKGFIL